jgi:hypothetical protein
VVAFRELKADARTMNLPAAQAPAFFFEERK